MSEQPRKRVKVADTADDDEGGGAAAEVDAAVASAASPTDNLEKLVRSLKSYPLMDEVIVFFLPPFPPLFPPCGGASSKTLRLLRVSTSLAADRRT